MTWNSVEKLSAVSLPQPRPSPDTGSCSSGVVIAPRGDLDICDLRAIEDLIEDAFAAAPLRVIIDLSAVDFISIHVAECFSSAKNRASSNGIELDLINVSHRIRRTLDVTGSAALFDF